MKTIRDPGIDGELYDRNAEIQRFMSIESDCKIRNAEIEHNIILNGSIIHVKEE